MKCISLEQFSTENEEKRRKSCRVLSKCCLCAVNYSSKYQFQLLYFVLIIKKTQSINNYIVNIRNSTFYLNLLVAAANFFNPNMTLAVSSVYLFLDSHSNSAFASALFDSEKGNLVLREIKKKNNRKKN